MHRIIHSHQNLVFHFRIPFTFFRHPGDGPYPQINSDGFVKSPSAALRCILRHCGVPMSTPHSSGFARLASEAFYFAIPILSFYDFINSNSSLEMNFGLNIRLSLTRFFF